MRFTCPHTFDHPALHPQQAGFTLIELLVVTGLSIILMIGAASLFYSSIISNSRKTTLNTLKQEGDHALGQMEFLLRNAIRVEKNPSAPQAPACTNGMATITVRSQDNGISTFSVLNDRVASTSGTGQVRYLTSPTVSVGLADLTFNCQQTAQQGGYISISMKVNALQEGFELGALPSQTFGTSVNLRSF